MITGSVTSPVSSTSVTLPDTNLTIIGASVFAHTVAGHLKIPIDATRNGVILFGAPVAVTTLKVPTVQPQNAGPGSIVAFHFSAKGTTLNYTGTGLTSGTFIFYYGKPFRDSYALNALAADVQSFTTGNPGAFTFPGGPVKLTGLAATLGTDTNETMLEYRVAFNTSAGKSVTLSWSYNDPLEIIPLDNLPAAQSLTMTGTTTGTHVSTGYVAAYYVL